MSRSMTISSSAYYHGQRFIQMFCPWVDGAASAARLPALGKPLDHRGRELRPQE
ncbi:hypothetical protein [Desulfosporosinus sp. FKB]|uniref:hypothetical protein n=1 Tax=Desulfosporosinus sp. FKB TaxID=1969835 RepID=UPI001481D630|nr:hypothetical protein [Desulfosporosinus sp. FKB]